MRLFSIALFIILILTDTQAQSLNPKLESWENLIGDWKVLTYEPDSTGAWMAPTIGNAKISSILDGTFIKEEVIYSLNNGNTLTMYNILGVDPRNGKARYMALDKEYGTMDVYEGTLDSEKIMVSNLLSDEGFISDGQSLHFRLTFSKVRGGNHQLLVEYTNDYGKNWHPFSKNVYQASN